MQQTENIAPKKIVAKTTLELLTEDTSIMTAEQFEKWLDVITVNNVRSGEDPTQAEETLTKRLHAEKSVTDDTIMSLVQTWWLVEGSRRTKQKDETQRPTYAKSYFNTLRIIDDYLALSYGRPYLQAKLHRRKADLLKSDGLIAEEIKEREKTSQILESMHTHIDEDRIGNMLAMGNTFATLGDKQKADKLYGLVLSYPWYSIEDERAMDIFFDMYITAGRGLISVNKGNLARLKSISLAPGARKILDNELRRAIVEAELKEQ